MNPTSTHHTPDPSTYPRRVLLAVSGLTHQVVTETQQADYQTARKYWNQLKVRLGKDGSQLVTACHQLKMPADAGKQRLTDVATAETLLRLVQSIPSPKAEPIKLWLAKAGYPHRKAILGRESTAEEIELLKLPGSSY